MFSALLLKLKSIMGQAPAAPAAPVRIWPPTPDLAQRAVLADLDDEDAPVNLAVRSGGAEDVPASLRAMRARMGL